MTHVDRYQAERTFKGISRFTLGLASMALSLGLHAQAVNPLALGALASGSPGAAGSAYAGGGAATLPGVPVIRSADLVNPITAPVQGGPATASGGLTPPNAASAVAVLDQVRPNEFQRYVLETSGYKLPLFGLSFFDNVQYSQRATVNPMAGVGAVQGAVPGGLGFAALDNAPVSGDYLLGVGDQLVIRGWG